MPEKERAFRAQLPEKHVRLNLFRGGNPTIIAPQNLRLVALRPHLSIGLPLSPLPGPPPEADNTPGWAAGVLLVDNSLPQSQRRPATPISVILYTPRRVTPNGYPDVDLLAQRSVDERVSQLILLGCNAASPCTT